MAVYRQIHISFWQDPFVLDLTPEEKYFYLYLMTNSKTSQCGVYEIPLKVMVLETGYNDETISKLLKKFREYEKIEYDAMTREIFIKNWLKYNSCRSPKVMKRVNDEICCIKCDKFKTALLRLLIQYAKTIDTQPQKEEEKEEEKEYSPNSEEFRLSNLLFELIKQRNPNHKAPNIQKWCESIRLMIERDNRTVDNIEQVLRFSQADEFWQNNILSTDKLRKQFDKLFLKMQSSGITTSSTQSLERL